MKKNILFGIGIMIIAGLSLVWFVQNVPVINFSSGNKSNINNNEYGAFSNDIGDKLKLGDAHMDYIPTSFGQIPLTVPPYTVISYQCTDCGSDCEKIEKDEDGKFKNSLCTSSCDECYKKTETRTDSYLSYSISSGKIVLSPGESVTCTVYCYVPHASSSNPCSFSGKCASGDGTHKSATLYGKSSGSETVVNTVSYGGKSASATLNIQYCGPWEQGSGTRYVKRSNYSLGEVSAIVGNGNYYLYTKMSEYSARSNIVKMRDGYWYTRCGVTPQFEKVCVYKPSSVGSGFKYADGYAWTDDPDQYTNKGWVIDESKTKSECGGCFGNATTLAASTSVKWGVGEHGVTGYKLDEVPSNQCYARETPKVCEPEDQNGSPTETLETDKCDDEENVYFVDGKWCNSGEPFYEIKCLNKYADKFDLEGEDVEVEEEFDIKQGVSVGLEVKTEGTKLCSAKFFSNTWDTVYFQVIEKLKAVDIEERSVRNAADVNEQRSWYITVLTKVLKQVNEYIDWKAKNEHNPTVKVELKDSSGASQKLNSPRGEGGQTVINFQYKPCTNGGEGKDDPNNSDICIPRCKFNDFDAPNCFPRYGKIDTNSGGFSSTLKTYKDDIEKDREGKKLISIEDYGITFSTNKITFRAKLNESKYVSIAMPEGGVDLSKVKNFMWYTEDKDEVTLIPPKVSLNWLSGEVLGSTTPIKVVDGYNRLYTDEEAEKGEQFKLEVHLENIGSSKSRVFDNICKLNVVETELTYRTIEETNPFINESRKKGYNWYRNGMDGTLYDFTKVIQGGGGYSASYEFNRDAIKAVKASNAGLGKEAYLGACYLGLDSTSAICSN